MGTKYRLKDVEKVHGKLDDLIPKLASEHGQARTAEMLNVSTSTVCKWLKENGYVQKITYIKEQAS